MKKVPEAEIVSFQQPVEVRIWRLPAPDGQCRNRNLKIGYEKSVARVFQGVETPPYSGQPNAITPSPLIFCDSPASLYNIQFQAIRSFLVGRPFSFFK